MSTITLPPFFGLRVEWERINDTFGNISGHRIFVEDYRGALLAESFVALFSDHSQKEADLLQQAVETLKKGDYYA